MDMTPMSFGPKMGWFTKCLATISGFDVERLERCPQEDWGAARLLALIMLAVAVYQATVLSLVGHKLFAEPGQIRPELIAGSILFAIFVLLIDSLMVMRSGLHQSGVEELKRGGLDISGGINAKIKAAIGLTIRLLLTCGMAQITAIFLALVIYGADIDADLRRQALTENGAAIMLATTQVDADIARATEDLKTETGRVEDLSKQAIAARNELIAPSSGDPRMHATLDEVSQLLARQSRAQEDLRNAETVETNELAGVKGSALNSGQPGNGPRHRAALEQVANAKRHLQDIAVALAAARGRLDALDRQHAQSDPNIQARMHDQSLAADGALAAEEARLASMRLALAEQERDREDTIRRKVESSPSYLPPENGALRQIKAIERIASGDSNLMLFILVVDLVCFILEAAAVLAKITSFIPMAYACNLARDAYMRAVRTADDMSSEIAAIDRGDRLERHFPMPANDNPANDDKPVDESNGFRRNPFDFPAKRPRGRPPKQPPEPH